MKRDIYKDLIEDLANNVVHVRDGIYDNQNQLGSMMI